MRKLTIAMAVIEQAEEYLLQLRSGDPAIGSAGLKGCFGGKVEEGEKPLDAVCRELAEETSLTGLGPKNVRYLGSYDVVSDHKLEMVEVHAEVFGLQLESEIVVRAHEGMLVRMTLQDILEDKASLTPATRAYFEQLERQVNE